MVSQEHWLEKKVLITGHTGFKGTWLCHMLTHLGAKVYGYALAPDQNPNLFDLLDTKSILSGHRIGDIREFDSVKNYFDDVQPETVFHLAAQPLVRESYEQPILTYQTNLMGTAHCLEAIRTTSSVRTAVIITTDKVYQNREWSWPYRENDELGGHDPYSSSKACCELAIASYRNSFLNSSASPRVASVRSGNVIGGGDFARDRIIPDIYRSVINKSPLRMRNPDACRPWLHVFDSLNAYVKIAQILAAHERSADHFPTWNIGPNFIDSLPVSAIVRKTFALLGVENPSIIIEKAPEYHESKQLMLDVSRTAEKLGWRPYWDLQMALKQTALWYNCLINAPGEIRDVSISQLTSYLSHKD